MGCLIINISFKSTLYPAFPHFFLHAMKTERAKRAREIGSRLYNIQLFFLLTPFPSKNCPQSTSLSFNLHGIDSYSYCPGGKK